MSGAVARLTAAALAMALALSAGACGKRGNLEPIDEERQTYPRTYPVR